MNKKNSTSLQSSINERKRSNVDIIADILKKTKKGARKTRLMYYCNLSYSQLENYLTFLLEIKLLESHPIEHNDKKSYWTTPRGQKFLDTYSQLKTLMI